MNKELITIGIISEYLRSKGKISKNISNIHDIFIFFDNLVNEKRKFNNIYILNYIYEFISSELVNKRKTNARVFEDLISVIFGGIVADNTYRQNLIFQVDDYFTNAKDIMAKNRREKADILFDNCQISLKTLIKNNDEINMGSFEKRVLFDGLNVDIYLVERKGINNAGIGSKPLLKKLFGVIAALEINSLSKFFDKFNRMCEFIYNDDLLIAIKNDKKMNLYFFSGKEIVNIFKEYCKNENEFLKIINRWEGNSLRIDKNALLSKCNKIVNIDFSFLNNTIIKNINDFDQKLHESYVQYFNGKKNKKEILYLLNNLFNKFETKFGELS